MKTLSFILAFAFVLAGPLLGDSSDASHPGIGTFSYNGAPVAAFAAPITPVLLASAR
jgi:hypothetical protein